MEEYNIKELLDMNLLTLDELETKVWKYRKLICTVIDFKKAQDEIKNFKG